MSDGREVLMLTGARSVGLGAPALLPSRAHDSLDRARRPDAGRWDPLPGGEPCGPWGALPISEPGSIFISGQ